MELTNSEMLSDKMRVLDLAASMSGLGTIDWDMVTGKFYYNDEILEMFGYRRDEVAQNLDDLEKFIIPEDYSEFRTAFDAFTRHDSIHEMFTKQLRVIKKDQTLLWVKISGKVAERTADGTPKRIFVGVLNIDRLVRAELDAQAALMESKKYKDQLENEILLANKDLEKMHRTSVAMFDANPYMNIIFNDRFEAVDCNPALIEFFGYPDKETTLKNVRQDLIDGIPIYQPNGEKSVTTEYRLVRAMQNGNETFETTFVFKGRTCPMNIIMKRINYMDSFAIVAYPVDLTDIKKKETELIYQDNMLHAANKVASALMESNPADFIPVLRDCLRMLVKSLNVDMASVWQNCYDEEQGQHYGKMLCEWSGENEPPSKEDYRIYYDPDLTSPTAWEDAFAGPVAENHLLNEVFDQLKNVPGIHDIKSILAVPILSQDGFWGFLGFNDRRHENRKFTHHEENIMRQSGITIAAASMRNQVTESLVAATDAALESSRAKSDFLSRMSHEIRTPLNAIIGMSAIAAKSNDIEKIRYCFDKVDAASRQLLELINDVLDVSKIESGKLELSPTAFDFERMMSDIFNMINVKMEEKNINFVCDFQRIFDRQIICDELRLSQVFINLLSNAAKFTPECGKVSLRVTYQEKDELSAILHVEVEDSGVGISTKKQSRLFRVFEQEDGSVTRQYGGTGLGLAICKSITQMMGGDIWVKSEKGQGSTFIFEVKFSWGESLHNRLPRLSDGQEAVRLLVVDDSPETLVYFSNVLEGFLAVCHTAAGGEEAVEKVRKAEIPYDIIFVDWLMPGLNGLQTIRALKPLLDRNTTLVVISAADRAQIYESLNDVSVTQVLQKPVLPSTLYNTVVSMTDRTQLSGHSGAFSSGPEVPDWRDKRILLVEDIEINREIIESLLEESGVAIETAEDGIEALAAFNEKGEHYHLILMDVQMPHMDGLTATSEIRKIGSSVSRNIPIVAMTANAFKEDIQICLDAGMNAHLAKPIDIEKLFQVLGQYL